MNYKIPFYGKKGTIEKIEVGDNSFVVHRYGINKGEITTFKVSKNSKNEELLNQNYYSDLEGYLTTNREKYNNYIHDKNLSVTNEKTSNILNVIFILLVGVSIPFLLSDGKLFFLGIGLNVMSSPFLITNVYLIYKDIIKKQKLEYIENYENISKKLMIYNNGKNIENPKIEFKGLNRNENKHKVMDNLLIRKRKK